MKINLQKILNFNKFLNKFNLVIRGTRVFGKKEYENDAEHSYQLAMLCWYLNDTLNLKLNSEKLLKYCLSHDLVEIYADDTKTFGSTKQQKESKQEREELALQKIKGEFAEFEQMSTYLEKYEEQLDPEAKFVKAVDKIISPINIKIDNGKTWKERKITFKDFLQFKEPKIKKANDKVVNEIYKQILPEIKDLFYI